MLELGFNLNEGDQFGWTPLFFAASKGRNKCAELLIKNGNNVNQLDNNGQTCLFWAAK
jgi:ankyrin repeat protein